MFEVTRNGEKLHLTKLNRNGKPVIDRADIRNHIDSLDPELFGCMEDGDWCTVEFDVYAETGNHYRGTTPSGGPDPSTFQYKRIYSAKDNRDFTKELDAIFGCLDEVMERVIG